MKKTDFDSEIVRKIKYNTKNHKYEKALELINEYLYENSNDYYMIVFKAMVLSRNGKMEEAKELINSIIGYIENYDNVRDFAYEELAIIANKEKNIDEAIKIYEELIAKSRYLCIKARCSLSILYTKKGLYSEAFSILNIDGFNNSTLNFARATIYYKRRWFKEALKELDRESINNYTHNYAKTYDSDEYIEGNKANVLWLKGLILQRLGRNKEALSTYKIALKYADSNKKIYFDILLQLASTNFNMGCEERCIELCKELIKRCNFYNKTTEAYHLLCSSYIRKGNIDLLNAIIEECKDDNIKKMCYAWIDYAHFNFEKALAILNSMNEDEFFVIYYKLQIMYRLDKYEEFLRLYDKYINMDNYDFSRNSSYDVERMKLFMEIRRNMETHDITTYTEKQFASYDKGKAIQHIIDNHTSHEYGVNFRIDTDFNLLYEYVIDRLNDSEMICDGICDKYFVRISDDFYDTDNKRIDYITAVCYANTKNIITMYPNIMYESNIRDNLQPKVQVKRLSQIEKFNKRYSK